MFANRRFSYVSIGCSLIAATATVTLPASVVAAADIAAPIVGFDADPDHVAQPEPQAAAIDPDELACMAKVVLHEAGGESRDGKVAVAQTLMNRLAAGRFGGSVCEVVNQPGQFFKTAAYNPDQDSARWAEAVEVSRAVLGGTADDVAPGAIFFHSAAARASGFFRSRQRVASIGRQIFYR